MMLNPRLLERQHINPAEEEYILVLHRMKDVLKEFEQTLNPDDSEDRGVFKQLPKIMEEIEYSMQKAWKFEQSKDYHTHWYSFSHCSCPIMDNKEMHGVPQRVLNMGCPLHGRDM